MDTQAAPASSQTKVENCVVARIPSHARDLVGATTFAAVQRIALRA
jgi:hypothetical protein